MTERERTYDEGEEVSEEEEEQQDSWDTTPLQSNQSPPIQCDCCE